MTLKWFYPWPSPDSGASSSTVFSGFFFGRPRPFLPAVPAGFATFLTTKIMSRNFYHQKSSKSRKPKTYPYWDSLVGPEVDQSEYKAHGAPSLGPFLWLFYELQPSLWLNG